MDTLVCVRILNEEVLPRGWESGVILRNKANAYLCTISPSNKYMTCLFGDVVACFAIHSVFQGEYICSFIGLATNPYEWGGCYRTVWYEEYGFLKVLFWDIDVNALTTKRIYFDRALYYAQKERLNGPG